MYSFVMGILAAAAHIVVVVIDPLFSSVLLLLHGDGLASGTSITDSSTLARTATVSGVTTETGVAGYFGSAQLRVEGGEYVQWPGLRLTGFNTWTIEGFLTLADIGSPRSHLFGSWDNSQGWTFDVASNGAPFLAINGSGAGSTGTVLLSVGTRTHIALVLTTASGSTTGTLYVNGVASQTYSGSECGWSAGDNSDLYQFRIGNRSDGSLNQNTSWDELRVTQGARYITNFTPPTGPYPNQADPVAARYWRLIGFIGLAGYLEMTEFQMLSGVTNLNSSATLTSSSAPSFGSLADLVDGSLSTRAYWTDTEAEDPTFFLRWDFGTDTVVDGFRMAGFDTNTRYPSGLIVEYSQDGSTWTTVRVITGATFPGGNTLSSTYSLP